MKYVCQYCGRECATKNGLVHHEVQCVKNPNRVIKTKTQYYSSMSNDELIKIIRTEYKDKTYKELSKINGILFNVLCKKQLTHILFPERRQMHPEYQKMSDDEILNIFNTEYSHVKNLSELTKINNSLVGQLIKRNLIDAAFPNKKRKPILHPEYKNMSDNELIKIVRTEYKDKTQSYVATINTSLINHLSKRNLLNEAFSNRKRKNYFIYKDMTDDEILKIFHTEYSHVKNKCELAVINKSLVNQLTKRNLVDVAFPNRQKFLSKDSKLNLLTDLDLESMDWASILDLIGLGKLPKEFSKLAKFGANIPGRKQMMQDLIDTYNITPIEEAEKEITDEFESDDDEVIPDIDTEKENKRIGNTLGNYIDDLANDSKFKHLREKSVNRLWTKVFDDKNYINEIYKKIENNSLTKFEKFIYEEFLDEYNEVENMEIH